MRTPLRLATAVATLALAAPAAHAVRPAPGDFYSADSQSGGHLIASKHAIRHLTLYCGGSRYDVRELVRIKRGGRFLLRRGTAERYGSGGSPRGLVRGIRVRGRFTSNDSVRMTRTLGSCGTGTAVLARD